MWTDAGPETTAEWECTGCGTINRRLVPVGAQTSTDRCIQCRRRHDLTLGPTPVRWTARAR